MNKALFKATLKENYKLFIIIFSVMVMYATIIVSMYDPNNLAVWDAMLETFPESLLNAMNFVFVTPDFLGYVAGYYYGFIMVGFPMIYMIMMSNRSIAKYVDNGSLSFMLATPLKRSDVAITKALYLFISTTLLLSSVSVVIFIIGLMVSDTFPYFAFFMLNLNLIGLFTLFGGISFLCSSYFNESRQAVAYASLFIVGFFVINMLRNANEQLAFLKYFTVFTFFNTTSILNLEPIIYLHTAILYIIGIGLYILGIVIFNRKDLHI